MVSSNDVGRVFLQAMISRGVVSDELARVLYGKCVEAVKAACEDVEISYNANDFDQYINEINRKLEPLDFKLCPIVEEVVGKKIWALTNTKGDELAQVATECSPVEIAYFKALVEQIVLASSESYSVSSMMALREVNSLKHSMTKAQAEVTLSNFVSKGWLLKSKRGRFSLSSRALLELQTYLKTNYEEDIHECTLCFELLTKGLRCHVPACGARLHHHCFQRYHRDGRTCPSCRADWSQPQKLVAIGEEAIKDGEDNRRARRRTEEQDESDEGSSEEEEPEPKAKSAKKGKGKRRYIHEEDDNSENDAAMELDDDESPAPTSHNSRRRR